MGIEKEKGGKLAPQGVSARSTKLNSNGESIAQNRFDGLTEAQYADLKAARYKAFRDGDDTPITLPNGFRFNPLDQAAYDALTVKATNGTGEPESPPQDATGEPKGNPLAIESPKRLRAQFKRQGIDCDAALLSPQPTDAPQGQVNGAQAAKPEEPKPEGTPGGDDEESTETVFNFASLPMCGGELPDKSAGSLDTALRTLGIRSRFNVRSDSPEHKVPGKTEWLRETDMLRAVLAETVADRFTIHAKNKKNARFTLSEPLWRQFTLAMLYTRQVDPVKVWLQSMAEWDGEPRVGKVLDELFGGNGDPLTQWASTFLFLGVIQRTYEPGCKLDESPVLISKQGFGKSSLLRHLFPTGREGQSWFSDGLKLDEKTQQQVEATLGKAMVEMSEMAGSTKGDIERQKAFMSRQDDFLRLSYDRRPQQRLRMFVTVGTSNNTECLPNDPSGNRRYVPIVLTAGSNVEAYMAEHRDMLWAEAMHLFFVEKQRANLPRELHQASAEQAEFHRSKNPTLEDWIDDDVMPRLVEGMSIREIMAMLGLPEGFKGRDRMVQQELEKRGCDKHNKLRDTQGSRPRKWYSPDSPHHRHQ